MDYERAVSKANQSARKQGEEYFVVFESGEYHIASVVDLDTFFYGISDNHILYSTTEDCSNAN